MANDTLRFKRNGQVVAIDEKFTGTEPVWADANTISLEDYAEALQHGLRFYGYYGDAEAFKRWTLTWMDSNPAYSADHYKIIKELPPTALPGTVGKLARMLMQGMPSSHPLASEHAQDAEKWIAGEMKYVFDRQRMTEAPPVLVVDPITPDQRRYNRFKVAILDPLEDYYDDICKIDPDVNYVPTFDIVRLVTSARIPANMIHHVIEWLERPLNEWKLAYSRECPDMVEGWSWMKRYQIKRLIAEFEKNIAGLYAYSKKKPKTNKPRVARDVPPERQVKSLNITTAVKGFKYTGCPAYELPNSSYAYLYIPAERQMVVVKAATAKSLIVKGKSIRGMHKSSRIFTLRKPDEFLDHLMSDNATPTNIEKFIKANIKTKARPFKGRVADKMMLLLTK